MNMAMFVLVLLFWGPALPTAGQDQPSNIIPRKTVTLSSSNGARVFQEEGVWNYSTMLLREDLGLLILGAREAIFALDLTDITHKKHMVEWQATPDMKRQCSHKGKSSEIECQNYIRILHKMPDGRMYVCGTNAFSPSCDYMSYTDGKLTLENNLEDGKGKCPFDPFQRYASEFVGNDLYSATSVNFLGSEPVLMRSSAEPIRTEFKTSWLNEPNFIGMKHIAEGVENPEGDDDKIYLFFSETALEYDSYSKLEVSRVARVCKGDLGGQRTLQKKWTSFVKARLDCLPHSSLPFLIQDVFHFCPGKWTTCVFYAVFTPQADSSQYSAVCAYGVNDIREVFAKGKFKMPVTVETSFVKWVMYTKDLPSPRPGACINNEARQEGFSKSLELPDKTLQFIKDKPLMDEAVKPMFDRPLVLKKGAAFTRIVVASVTALDGISHEVMFIGTASGSVLKAVNYDGEMVIIEEVQLFDISVPVKILRLSNTTDQLYVGSEVAVVQMPLSTCSSYSSCTDCVLARDPYCGWDVSANMCATINSTYQDTDSEIIQSLKDGNATRCPAVESPTSVNSSFLPGSTVRLTCQPSSNLAQVRWEVNERPVESSGMYYIQHGGLLIINASVDAAGLYTCSSVEASKGKDYVTQHAIYKLTLDARSLELLPQVQTQQHTVATLVVMVVLLSLTLLGLLMWNIYKGHCIIPGFGKGKDAEEGQQSDPAFMAPLHAADGLKVASRGPNSNNNHSIHEFSSAE